MAKLLPKQLVLLGLAGGLVLVIWTVISATHGENDHFRRATVTAPGPATTIAREPVGETQGTEGLLRFDLSAANPNDPHVPPKRVSWGWRSD